VTEERTEASNCPAITVIDTLPDLMISKALAKNPLLVQERARLFRLAGNPALGRKLVEDSIRHGGWTKAKLWWELVSLMASPADYEVIRSLWLQSPDQTHGDPSIQRAVARAAAVAGEHHECRTMLRRLILGTSQTIRSTAMARAKRALHEFARRSTFPAPPSKDDFSSRAAVALTDLNQAFSEVGIKAFLISGTLLGQVRQGGIIGWDKDIDVGFFTEECGIDLETHFMQHRKFRLGRVDLTSDRLRIIHSNGMWIDVFPHYMEGDMRWHNGTATRWWNTPFALRKIEFLGIDQYVPDDPERYLDENYGDWRTPNSNFDARIDAPNAEISDPEHFVSLLFFSLEKSIRDRKQLMKRRYIDLLRSQGEGAWLDRI